MVLNLVAGGTGTGTMQHFQFTGPIDAKCALGLGFSCEEARCNRSFCGTCECTTASYDDVEVPLRWNTQAQGSLDITFGVDRFDFGYCVKEDVLSLQKSDGLVIHLARM